MLYANHSKSKVQTTAYSANHSKVQTTAYSKGRTHVRMYEYSTAPNNQRYKIVCDTVTQTSQLRHKHEKI